MKKRKERKSEKKEGSGGKRGEGKSHVGKRHCDHYAQRKNVGKVLEEASN